MKRPFLWVAVVLVILFAIPAVSFADDAILPQSANGANLDLTGTLVPDLPTGADYNLCTLRDVANNFIKFAVVLSVFVATLMFAYGGILYVTASGAGEEQLKKAHNVFVSVFIGLVVVLIAWLIVNIVVSVLTQRNLTSWTDWFTTGSAGCSKVTSQAFAPAPDQGSGTGVTGGTNNTTVNGYNPQNAGNYAATHAASRPLGSCAYYVRTALANGGGLTLCNSDHPGYAYQYATQGCLVDSGFTKISSNGYVPKEGDVVVFDKLTPTVLPKCASHSCGHIEIYSGSQWVSDFRQQGFLPATAYEGHNYTIFRAGG